MTSESVTSHSDATVYGVDGCPSGWFFIRLTSDGKIVGNVAERFEAIVKEAGDSDRIFVDMPIGLPEGDERRDCDVEARSKLGSPRASSVFPTPVRKVLRTESYEQANQISKSKSGRDLTPMSWALVRKIREVDELLRRSRKARNIVREVHPEICFWALAGGRPMSNSKREREGEIYVGIEERLDVLTSFRSTIRDDYREILQKFKRKDVARDDILDAMAAAITAQAPTAFRTLPELPLEDACGLRMEMVYRGIGNLDNKQHRIHADSKPKLASDDTNDSP